MDNPLRNVIQPGNDPDPESEPLLSREWLVTNGLGGYASGTVNGLITRSFHGYLIASLPSPLGRTMVFNDLVERFELPEGSTIQLGGEERAGAPLRLHGVDFLLDFRLDIGLPVWRYRVGAAVIEKRLVLPHGQNTVYVRYRVLEGDGDIRMSLRPSLHFRPHNTPVSEHIETRYFLTVIQEDQYEVSSDTNVPPLRFMIYGQRPALTVDRQKIDEIVYRIEASRGYSSRGALWSPGLFNVMLSRAHDVILTASTDPWPVMNAMTPDEAFGAEYDRRRLLLSEAHPAARDGVAAELVLAADQFIITPTGRVQDTARARAAGHEIRSVIAGYHWFTDWGRDTMISLEGLTLTTGRHNEAGYILRTFAHYIRDGLIPNMFPEGENEGLYHTADATMWFFHALDRYLEITGDRSLLRMALPKLLGIVECHLRGARFNIHADPKDGLISQGAEGYQLTWMDAKVDGWVVTPRRGKAVEINGLWYNALRLLEQWLVEEDRAGTAISIREHADRVRESFNQRFWYEAGGHLYDVIDGPGGDDPSLRPNQVLSIAPRYPVLDESRWEPVMEAVARHLLTPVGLRSLAPGSPDYKAKYYGDLRSRDAAYHQGTVWAWLIGPYIDAYLKLHPTDLDGALHLLAGFVPHLDEACVGSISEIFDAEVPFTPRGCVAQAWSVAEVLRCWAKIESLRQDAAATREESTAPA